MEMLIKKCIHHCPAERVVVVFKIEMFSFDFFSHSIKRVKLFEFWKALGLEMHCPIVGRRKPQWPWRSERGEIDIPYTDPKITCILTGTSSLHGGRCHDRRKRGGDPIVDCREHEGLRTAARGARDTNPRGIDFGKR